MFVAGMGSSFRLGIHNVVEVFSAVKAKMLPDAVIWLGGCNIGANDEFCRQAAAQSGCTVVAASNVLEAMRVKKGFIDMLDRYAGPKVFYPGKTQAVTPAELCAKQRRHKFEVPV
jgi:hypothetical protein